MTVATLPEKPASASASAIEVRVHSGPELVARLPALNAYAASVDTGWLSRDLRWLTILSESMGHTPYCLEAVDRLRTRGILPLAFLDSLLFGRFLVSLPYLNYGGVIADDDLAARALIDQAVELADHLRVRFLELRHERAIDHPRLVQAHSAKVNMRLTLPDTTEELWRTLPQKARNRVRKARTNNLSVVWGREELIPEFYAVFSRNMRDLGTPVYSRQLFRSILKNFPDDAELCVIRNDSRAISAALLLHGNGVTEVPSASSLRSDNHLSPNMLMYWHLLERAINRGQRLFDFGRSSVDSGAYQFKKHWGATPSQTAWQFYCRDGDVTQMRSTHPKYRRLIHIWQRMPVSLSRLLGPLCVRGIP